MVTNTNHRRPILRKSSFNPVRMHPNQWPALDHVHGWVARRDSTVRSGTPSRCGLAPSYFRFAVDSFRQRDREPTPGRTGRLPADGAALCLHGAAGDGQTQAGPTLGAATSLEGLEDRPQLFRRQARAGVAHIDHDLVATIEDLHVDLSRIGVLHGVVGEIGDRRPGEHGIRAARSSWRRSSRETPDSSSPQPCVRLPVRFRATVRARCLQARPPSGPPPTSASEARRR